MEKNNSVKNEKPNSLIKYVKSFDTKALENLIEQRYSEMKGDYAFDALVGYKSAYGFASLILAIEWLKNNYGSKAKTDIYYLESFVCFQFCGEIFGLIHYKSLLDYTPSVKYNDFEKCFTYLEENLSEKISKLPFSQGLFPDKLNNPIKSFQRERAGHMSLYDSLEYFLSLGLFKNIMFL